MKVWVLVLILILMISILTLGVKKALSEKNRLRPGLYYNDPSLEDGENYTFKSMKMGFSVRLPKDLLATDSYTYNGYISCLINFTKSRVLDSSQLEETNFTLSVSQDKRTLADLRKTIPENAVILSQENLIIDGQEAIYFKHGGANPGEEIHLTNGKYSVIAKMYPEVSKVPFRQIMTSFKFPVK